MLDFLEQHSIRCRENVALNNDRSTLFVNPHALQVMSNQRLVGSGWCHDMSPLPLHRTVVVIVFLFSGGIRACSLVQKLCGWGKKPPTRNRQQARQRTRATKSKPCTVARLAPSIFVFDFRFCDVVTAAGRGSRLGL